MASVDVEEGGRVDQGVTVGGECPTVGGGTLVGPTRLGLGRKMNGPVMPEQFECREAGLELLLSRSATERHQVSPPDLGLDPRSRLALDVF